MDEGYSQPQLVASAAKACVLETFFHRGRIERLDKRLLHQHPQLCQKYTRFGDTATCRTSDQAISASGSSGAIQGDALAHRDAAGARGITEG